MELILKHISTITSEEYEDLFQQGYDMEVDQMTKIAMFKKESNVDSYLSVFEGY